VATELPLLAIPTRKQWRKWLEKNHAKSPGVWLVFNKQHTGLPSIPYDDSVCEALCFGWIDSLIKRLDDDRYARKFTPRKPTSKWSLSNRKRWAQLNAAGLLAAPGLAAAPTDNSYRPKQDIPELPTFIAKAFQSNAAAWRFFHELPPTERRNFVVWIYVAKRPETRDKRIRESIELLATHKKLGLK
jgi:uncharacterized protein YdeI (YjbR/CyaY-like superfamily)